MHSRTLSRVSTFGDGFKRIRLIMELCTGRELYDRLAKKKRYCEQDAAKVAQQMLSAINYCHQRRICHRDIKLENWVYRDSQEDAPLKLIDFGFSRLFDPKVQMSAMHGTVYYVSPEVMDGKYNEKCDMWSIGVIIYMLLSGSPPFTGQGDQEILVKIKRGTYSFAGPRWEGISSEAKSFVSSLLRKDPKERPSAAEALKHFWIKSVGDSNVDIDVTVLKNMQTFAAFSAIKRAALGLIALSMHSKELDELEKLFKTLDIDKKGTIKVEDLVAILVGRLDVPEEEAMRIFKRIDQTGDAEINYSEFVASTFQTKIALSQQMIMDAFQRFDVDNSGNISLNNLRYVLGDEFGGSFVEDILKQCDPKNSGVIDFDEFMRALIGDEVPQPLEKKDRVEQSEVLCVVQRNICELVDTVMSKLNSKINVTPGVEPATSASKDLTNAILKTKSMPTDEEPVHAHAAPSISIH